MNHSRFQNILASLPLSRIAVVGDFCLDRYLEIDPARAEISIETGLEVHNVTNVRSQPGAAGTILNNLVEIGVSEIYPVGFCGEDGEGYELLAALRALPGVQSDHFLQTEERRTFTYCKPLVLVPGQPPRELNRLDSKNWSPTPESVSQQIVASLETVAAFADAVIIMDQVGVPETGVVTASVRTALGKIALTQPQLLMLADSRRGLKNYPPVCLKMNERELVSLTGAGADRIDQIKAATSSLAVRQKRFVFVTLAERGIVGAAPEGEVEHVPAFATCGEIDIVGAGDAVTANLTATLAAGATLREALEIAMAAASIVIHQLGTTGTATMKQIRALMFPELKRH